MRKLLAAATLCCTGMAASAQTYMKVETTQGTYRIDIADINQVTFETIEEVTVKPYEGETTIYSDAKVGDKGLIDGQEVIVVKLNDTKLAIATCNYGADYPFRDGTYMNFKNARKYNNERAWGETWRLPTFAEMNTLILDPTVEVSHYNMVPGCYWYIGADRTPLFFPMAGEKSYGELTGHGEVGYYWTSDSGGDGAWCMGISPDDGTFYVNAYSTDVLSVRLVSDLRGRP